LAALNSAWICARNNRTGCLSCQVAGGVMDACYVGDVGRAADASMFFDWLKETHTTLIKQDSFIVRTIHVESPTGILHIYECRVASSDPASGTFA